MGYWSILVPEATKNYLPNPSLEKDATGYTDYATGTAAGTRARSLVWQKRGAYSYKIAKTSGGATDHYGFSVAASLPTDFDNGESATFSVDLNIVSGTVVIKIEATVGGTPQSTTETIVGPAAGRYDVTHLLTGDATAVTAYVYISTATGEFYADGLQVENKAYATTYIDGDQAGGVWTGYFHNSPSTRPVTSRAGGREYNLDDYALYISEPLGIGLPSISHLVHPLNQRPGALLRGFKIQPRVFTLASQIVGTSRPNVHSKRKALIDILKPDFLNLEPVTLRYTGANSSTPVEIAVTYDGGLEFGSLAGYTENVAIRLIAYDPVWREDGDVAVTLSSQTTVSDADYLMKKVNNIWSNVSTSFNGIVFAIAQGLDGKLYFGGAFADVGDANGDGIVAYDPSTGAFSSLGTGLAGGVGTGASCIAIAPNGDLIVGGNFTGAGGVANTARLARWSISSQVWQSITPSGAADADVRDAVFDQDGILYVIGSFTTLNGAAKAYIAKMATDGTWSALGTGLSAGGVALAVSPAGVVHVGGGFATANGVTVNGICYWNGTTFVAMGSGQNATVSDLLFGRNGLLYLCGTFTQVNGASGFNRIASWNGVSYSKLGDGFTNTVGNLGMDEDGLLYTIDIDAKRLVTWNGSLWIEADVILPTPSSGWCSFLLTGKGDFYMGGDFTGTAQAAAQTIVSNDGTADAYPKLVITRSGGTSAVLAWLRNDTTGDTIYLDYSLLAGESLTFDFTPGQRSITSSLFGPVWRAVHQRSQVGAFRLVKGDNVISFWANTGGSPTITSYIQWRNTHDAADGVAA